MKSEKIIVFSDGGARGNPGPAAIGVVIMRGNQAIGKYAESIGERTNNEAEYEAVIFALQKIKHLFGKQKTRDLDVEVRVDSELVALGNCRENIKSRRKDFFLFSLKFGILKWISEIFLLSKSRGKKTAKPTGF